MTTHRDCPVLARGTQLRRDGSFAALTHIMSMQDLAYHIMCDLRAFDIKMFMDASRCLRDNPVMQRILFLHTGNGQVLHIGPEPKIKDMRVVKRFYMYSKLSYDADLRRILDIQVVPILFIKEMKANASGWEQPNANTTDLIYLMPHLF